MIIDVLKKYADKLLDLSSRNRLINFRDTRVSTAELLYPDVSTFFKNIISNDAPIDFIILNKKDELAKKKEDEENAIVVDSEFEKQTKKEKILKIYEKNLNKNKNILFYNGIDTYSAIKGISKKSLEYYIETGNNITYLCFGFLRWKESENSKMEYNSPLLLVKCKLIKAEVNDSFILKIDENDVILNSTLKYKLKNELDVNLPDYKDEQDIESYLSEVNKITNKCFGAVKNECKISNNSFLRLNMFEDIKKNIDSILKNPIIAKLLGDNSVKINNEVDESFKTSKYNPIIDLHNVVEADSSQIEAIEKAKSGASFVLQGPPGTGKSQTITNIISECLYDNKKILFVSEKLAALNIVYNNLNEAGLGDFCLQLHSQKTNKTEFLKDLSETIKKEKVAISNKINDYENMHEDCIKNLDKYENEFYTENEVIGKNLRELYIEYYKYRKIPEVVYYNSKFINENETWINNQKELVLKVLNYTDKYSLKLEDNLWYGVDIEGKDISQIASDFKKDINILNVFFDIKKEFKNEYKIEINDFSNLKYILQLKDVLINSKLNIKKSINIDEFAKLNEILKKLIKLKENIFHNAEYIKKNYYDNIFTICDKLDKKILEEKCDVWYKRIFNSDYSKIKKKYKPVFLNKKSNYKTICNAIEKIEQYNNENKKYNELVNNSNLSKSLHGDYKDINSDLNEIYSFIIAILEMKSIFNDEVIYNFDIEFNENINRYVSQINQILEYNFYTINYVDYKKKFNCELNNIEILDICNKMYRSINCIPEWKMFLENYLSIKRAGLLDFIEVCTDNGIDNLTIPNVLLKCFYKQWIDHIFESNKYLRTLDRATHDSYISKFDNSDKIKYQINKSKIKEKLSNNRPNMNFVDLNANSSVANILKESVKKRKQKSIKDVIEENGEFIQKIKPCFLMSPLSVSTFLSGDVIKFDVVIFDEASQIFPEDSICSIYRGKQVIIVGDSKQMPPSNFFISDFDVDDSLYSDVGSFESILDVASAILPEIRLLWHYRSRNEDLIAFSNNYFYNNKLVTFKAAQNGGKDFGVNFEYVPKAVYEKGKNVIEAKKVVDKIFEHFDKYKNARSIGVIAFGIKQQEAIENELEKRLEESPQYKEYCVIGDKTEPFFIKNLETVQGDERDTIIFSIGYGHDQQGRFLLNFGPLSRQGGERRLNVAATRAKYNVQVVSSIKGSEINVKQISSEGGKLLSNYLQYAQDGKIVLEKDIKVDSIDKFDSEFEMDVCDFLRSNGYDVDTQVGSSGYKIDMAVKKPNSADYYVAIECDGATYHSSKNARDRDRLRQRVLENLGWKFYRIWSTDWFLHNVSEKNKLLEFVEKCKNAKKDIQKQNVEINLENIANKNIDFPEYKFSIAKYRNAFNSFLYQVLEDEAPLSEEWFLRRYVKIFDREKVTSVVRDQYNNMIKSCNRYDIVRKNGFLFIKNKHIIFRTQGTEKRPFEFISDAELASGMYVILKNNMSMTIESLFKQICHLQECSTTESNINQLKSAIKYLLKEKKDNISINGDYIEYKEN